MMPQHPFFGAAEGGFQACRGTKNFAGIIRLTTVGQVTKLDNFGGELTPVEIQPSACTARVMTTLAFTLSRTM